MNAAGEDEYGERAAMLFTESSSGNELLDDELELSGGCGGRAPSLAAIVVASTVSWETPPWPSLRSSAGLGIPRRKRKLAYVPP